MGMVGSVVLGLELGEGVQCAASKSRRRDYERVHARARHAVIVVVVFVVVVWRNAAGFRPLIGGALCDWSCVRNAAILRETNARTSDSI